MDSRDAFTEDDLLAHVRGESSADLSARIEAAAEQDAQFRSELGLMRGLRAALQDEDVGNPPGELGWRRLEAAIAQESRQSASVSTTSTWWRVAAVFLGIAVLGQGTFIASRFASGEDPLYRTVTAPTDQFVLGIAFASTASLGDMSALLQEFDGQMVEGPSAIGFYRVAFEDQGALAAARAAFEQSPLIELVAEE